MQIQILGAHATETKTAKPTAILVDDILALDAGGLCSSLTLSAQQKLRAILVTHYHYDHVRDIPLIAMNIAHQATIDIYSTSSVFDALSTHLLDGIMYPDFRQWPQQQPAIRLTTIEPHSPFEVDGYSIIAIPVSHSVPSVGFQVTSPEGKRLFYTGDTGGGLSTCWNHVSPDLLITEVTLPQKLEQWAKLTGHLSPQLLKSELLDFRRMKGYVPTTIVIHLNPLLEGEIAPEIAEVALELGASISLGQEGMKVTL